MQSSEGAVSAEAQFGEAVRHGEVDHLAEGGFAVAIVAMGMVVGHSTRSFFTAEALSVDTRTR